MFEMLMGKNSNANDGAGVEFLGEVAASELISGPELAGLFGLTAGTTFNNNEGWLKFYDGEDRQTKWVAKKPFRHTLTHQDLAAKGLLEGQTAWWGERFIQCRSIKCSNINPPPFPSDDSYNHPSMLDSEWVRLMYPLIANNPNGHVFEQTYDLADIGLNLNYGSFTASFHVNIFVGHDRIDRIHRGTISGAPWSRGWRPLLFADGRV